MYASSCWPSWYYSRIFRAVLNHTAALESGHAGVSQQPTAVKKLTLHGRFVLQVMDMSLLLPSSYQYMGYLRQLEVLHLNMPHGELQVFPAEFTACLSTMTALKDLAILGHQLAYFSNRCAFFCQHPAFET